MPKISFKLSDTHPMKFSAIQAFRHMQNWMHIYQRIILFEKFHYTKEAAAKRLALYFVCQVLLLLHLFQKISEVSVQSEDPICVHLSLLLCLLLLAFPLLQKYWSKLA